ncbi:hypothetical protein LTR91_001306 [Friedmanniomyces endolithicus]|uniref:Uncharacterized protein n=1 Tax=Friedmanniomyces endolithicus TaxID=329885 RepID=A0AAN6J8K3_9PEZI|nr:hypothetical protein LTR35_012604 [Friedmanniomyces endolithicus]KAK0283872.1 hypothetical protein LTS00_011535 [Friedmanniomyces endolithicus]KAK0320416.1 hypothetical protein LTR82_008531 [Friedmanniomyces endolithicus]KAK0829022.1 hypothetical protein LTR73_004655 [Friedmanniomyces endolithicus]KAK0929791.1 hypothetical protein LTR57_001648 [Friedmanniomyces endolithicus]
MPPIPVHIDDPITPTRPQGITPQTAAHEHVVPSPATYVATTTTAAAARQSGYPAARPAVAVPAPTPYIPIPQTAATRTTSSLQNENIPPPPQPGAVPVPFQQPQQQASSGLPPPPRAGETAKTRQGSAFTGALNNMYTPPPPAAAQHLQQNYAPTHSTSTTAASLPTTPQRAGPTTLNYGPVASPLAGSGYRDTGPDTRRVSAEEQGGGRGGYVQNVYAQEMSSAQRASLEEEVRRESFVDKLGLGGVVGGGAGHSVGGGSGGFGGTGREGEERGGEGLNGAWDAARGWFGKAASSIAEGEQEVWRRINGH